MRTAISRVEKVERNRELVLEAARRVFLAKGHEGASLDAIAEDAGFSKGAPSAECDGPLGLTRAKTLHDSTLLDPIEPRAMAA
jgi:hypothetical protein